MKMIVAIIRPTQFHDVKEALSDVGVISMTVTDVKGRGMQRGIIKQWRGREYCTELLDKLKLEVVVKEEKVEDTIDAIVTAARTGEVGDGKIFTIPVDDVMRISTGDRGDAAL